jgi:DUF971 family protein
MFQTELEMSPPTAPGTAPDRIVLGRDRGELRLSYSSGSDLVITAKRLRGACKCAHCTRAKIDGTFPTAFDRLSISEVSAMGNFGINIAFSDGHTRGIYPWAYLQQIASTQPHGETGDRLV